MNTATHFPDLTPYRHVIWDWNGTLLDDAWLCVDVMNGLLREHDLPLLTVERYQQDFDFPVVEYYRRLGFDFAKMPFEEVGTEFIRRYEQRRLECGPREGAREAVQAVRDAGLTQSVLSAYKQNTLEEFVAHLGLREFFVNLIGLQDHYAAGKKELGRKWLQETHRAPGEILLVGDTTHDAEVAREMGTDCLLVFGGHNSVERLRTCGVPVLSSLADLVTALRHLPRA